MKAKKEANEMVTKGMFQKGMDDLAMLINKSFIGMESRMAKQEDLLALTARVDKLEKRMERMENRMERIENSIDDIYRELKNIREEIKTADTRADVIDLQFRVTKLEKKIK